MIFNLDSASRKSLSKRDALPLSSWIPISISWSFCLNPTTSASKFRRSPRTWSSSRDPAARKDLSELAIESHQEARYPIGLLWLLRKVSTSLKLCFFPPMFKISLDTFFPPKKSHIWTLVLCLFTTKFPEIQKKKKDKKLSISILFC